MRVLVVSQYFPPEPGATQNRMAAFVDGLRQRGHEVTVICEQPNHPAGAFHPGFGDRPLRTERAEGLAVHRLWVAASPRKTTARRIAFYASFAVGAAVAGLLVRRPDVVFATSPPLPGALAAGAAAALRRVPLVVDVRDPWPAAAEALGELSNPRAMRTFERLERWLYGRSAGVTATTRPFCRHVDAVSGRGLSVHLPNGALDELVDLPDTAPPSGGPFVVAYAGNLGIAQGLEAVLDAAEALRGEDVRLRIVGDGPLASTLRRERAARSLDHLELEPSRPVERIGEVLTGAHALLVPLRAHPLMRDFIPSKVYDAMAVGRPVILAAEGESARLVEESACGVVVAPEDGDALARAIRELAADRPRALALGAAGRAAARDHARSRQVERLEAVLVEAARR